MFPFIIKPNIGDNIGLSMKILLTLIICSYTHGACLDPYPWPETFNSTYDCMMAGYEEASIKMKEMGPKDVNKHQIYIRFTCSPIDSV